MADHPDVSSDDAGLSILQNTSSACLFCEPCKEEGYHYEAAGYCVDCTHHLCMFCFKHHRTPRPTRYHKLLNRQEMPHTKQNVGFKDECTDKCSVHGDKTLEYYCENHDMFVCSVCVTLKHNRSCKVEYIPILSANLFSTEEYKLLKLALESMVRNTNCIHNTAARNLEEDKKNAEAVFVKIRHFRKEIETFFDELENEISKKLSAIRDETEKALTEILKESKRMGDKLKNIEKEMKEKEFKGLNCRLFVDMKQLGKTIVELENNISKMEKNNTIQELTFKPSCSVTSFIRNKSEVFGSLIPFHERVPLPSDIDYVGYVHDIDILSKGRLAIQLVHELDCDAIVYLIDTDYMPTQIVTTMFPSRWNGSAKVSKNEIAVTTYDGNIQIYSVNDKFVLKKTIHNANLHNKLAYTNGLFIGCSMDYPYNLRMVNMEGDVIKTFPTTIKGGVYGTCWIAAHPDHNRTNVFYLVKGTVTCLTFEGEVKAEYKPEYEWWPSSITVSSEGLVYVDGGNNDIHILTSDLKPYDVIFGTKYGLLSPRRLAVCDKERKLYALGSLCEIMNVFNI